MNKILIFSVASFVIQAAAQSIDPLWVPGSSQKVCQPNGQNDYQTGKPTVSQTQTNYGLLGNDLGASFEHNGKLWILFGDTWPAPTFNGKPNAQNDPPRTPLHNDAIAFTSGTDISQCLKLDFVRNSIGAYQNPVPLNAQGAPAIALGDFEVPMAGIDVGGRMFVIFATDSNRATVAKGFSTRSVVAVSDDDGNTYHYLYDLSVPSCALCSGAKFVNVSIGAGTDGYLYFGDPKAVLARATAPCIWRASCPPPSRRRAACNTSPDWPRTARRRTGPHPSPTRPGSSKMSMGRRPLPKTALALWASTTTRPSSDG
jgi:hypothetical protein